MSATSRSALMSVPPRRAEAMGISVIVILAVGTCGWWLLHTASAQFSQTIRDVRAKSTSTKSLDALADRIRTIAQESDVLKTLKQLQREAAEKQRGVRSEEVRITGPDGEPLKRSGQLTNW